MNSYQRRGAGAIGIIVGIVAVLLIGGVIWYFVSDPFKSKIDKAVEEATKWTPDRIAKEPEAYLDYCEQQSKAALEKLKVHRTKLALSKGDLKKTKEDADALIAAGEAGIQGLGKLYKEAESSNAFPVKFKNQNFEKEQAARAILMWKRQVDGKKKLLATVENGIAALDAQGKKIDDAQFQAEDQLVQIKTSRETLKVSKLSDSLKDQLVKMQGVLSATVAIADQPPSVPSLEQLKETTLTTVDDAELRKALDAVK